MYNIKKHYISFLFFKVKQSIKLYFLIKINYQYGLNTQISADCIITGNDGCNGEIKLYPDY